MPSNASRIARAAFRGQGTVKSTSSGTTGLAGPLGTSADLVLTGGGYSNYSFLEKHPCHGRQGRDALAGAFLNQSTRFSDGGERSDAISTLVQRRAVLAHLPHDSARLHRWPTRLRRQNRAIQRRDRPHSHENRDARGPSRQAFRRKTQVASQIFSGNIPMRKLNCRDLWWTIPLGLLWLWLLVGMMHEVVRIEQQPSNIDGD